VPGHARTPGRHQRLGGPLPRQQPNTTTARPTAPELWLAEDAPSQRRWELPAVSRGYARPWGWLPSPYSPLRHWPDPKTGPVRLACLIHAANVHSEPGSNPSIMSRSPERSAGENPQPPLRRPILTSRVEENAGRTPSFARGQGCRQPARSDAAGQRPRAEKRTPAVGRWPRRTGAGPCEPSPGDAAGPGDRPGRAFRFGIDHSHAGSPQGFMTRRTPLVMPARSPHPKDPRLVVFG
jgi:hypothetical protein